MKPILLVPVLLACSAMGGCLRFIVKEADPGGKGPEVSVTNSNGDDTTIDVGQDSQQIVGSGPVTSETRTVPSFHGVAVGSVIHLKFSTGPAQGVQVAGQANVLPHLITKVKDGVLDVELRGSFKDLRPITVTISNPHLDYLEASGASDATATGVDESSMKVDVSGSSRVNLDAVATSLKTEVSGAAQLTAKVGGNKNLSAVLSGNSSVTLTGTFGDSEIECSGASVLHLGTVSARKTSVTSTGTSQVEVSGETADLRVECNGAGGADLSGLVAVTCKASATGASKIHASVTKELTADASGAAEVEYKGKPNVHQTTSGVGRVTSHNGD